MGNKIAREFDIDSSPTVGGPGGIWNIHSARRRSNGEQVSIFMAEKKHFKGVVKKASGLKRKGVKEKQEEYFELLRKDAFFVNKLEHAMILRLKEPLGDSGDIVAMVTEPVVGSLAEVIERLRTNQPLIELSELDIKCGALNIADALHYCHSTCSLIHMDVSPENIYITTKGVWKLAGFFFSVELSEMQKMTGTSREIDVSWKLEDNEPELPYRTVPSAHHCAPEAVIRRKVSALSDMYSLGSSLFYGYTAGNNAMSDRAGTLEQYRAAFTKVASVVRESRLPDMVKSLISILTTETITTRPMAADFMKHALFGDDDAVKYLHYIESMEHHDNAEKVKFLKSFQEILKMFDPSLQMRKIFPVLLEEACNPELGPLAMVHLLSICEHQTSSDFMNVTFPRISMYLDLEHSEGYASHMLLVLLQRIDVFMNKCPEALVKSKLLPFLFRAYESNNSALLEEAMVQTSRFSFMIEFGSLKTTVLPKIREICTGTKFLRVRVNCLLCLSQIFSKFDKNTVVDYVIPTLVSTLSVDRSAPVLMCVLGTADALSKYLGPDLTATRILPFLMPLLVEKAFNEKQYNTAMFCVHQMIKTAVDSRLMAYEGIRNQKGKRESGEHAAIKMPVISIQDLGPESEPSDGKSGSGGVGDATLPDEAEIEIKTPESSFMTERELDDLFWQSLGGSLKKEDATTSSQNQAKEATGANFLNFLDDFTPPTPPAQLVAAARSSIGSDASSTATAATAAVVEKAADMGKGGASPPRTALFVSPPAPPSVTARVDPAVTSPMEMNTAASKRPTVEGTSMQGTRTNQSMSMMEIDDDFDPRSPSQVGIPGSLNDASNFSGPSIDAQGSRQGTVPSIDSAAEKEIELPKEPKANVEASALDTLADFIPKVNIPTLTKGKVDPKGSDTIPEKMSMNKLLSTRPVVGNSAAPTTAEEFEQALFDAYEQKTTTAPPPPAIIPLGASPIMAPQPVHGPADLGVLGLQQGPSSVPQPEAAQVKPQGLLNPPPNTRPATTGLLPPPPGKSPCVSIGTGENVNSNSNNGAGFDFEEFGSMLGGALREAPRRSNPNEDSDFSPAGKVRQNLGGKGSRSKR